MKIYIPCFAHSEGNTDNDKVTDRSHLSKITSQKHLSTNTMANMHKMREKGNVGKKTQIKT